MAILKTSPAAFGRPGIEPRWTRAAKDAVGTAYSTSSRVWFTTSAGVVNEVYFSTIDRPQIRDMQLMITDGKTFFHDQRRDLDSEVEYIDANALGVRIINSDRQDRYRIVKEVITDPHGDCLLMNVRLEGKPAFLRNLHLYVILAPHIEVGGWRNNGNSARIQGREFLTANKDGVWLALAATIPFVRRSCGYVGTTDGWADLAANFKMDFQFASAQDGNIALTGELDLRQGYEFTVGLAFGRSLHRAVTTLFQTFGVPYSEHRARFIEQWGRAVENIRNLDKFSGDGGKLYRRSFSLLLSHEDKSYPGAMIASLSIPWGESKSDDDLGGYHLVWTRDLVQSATALLAAGHQNTPLRALIYLACLQQDDGGFPQNFWISGRPYWSGIQLDEVAFPIMLAWRLARTDGLRDFDPYPMVLAAARYLILHGPATPQERWEENSGFSPSTLASNIAALTCAAAFATNRGDRETARLLHDYADFLECHIETWTVTTQGTLLPRVNRHFIRINPIDMKDPCPDEDPDTATILVHNRGPGERSEFPAKEVVDGGFLELVRYGIRNAADPLIEDSLQVVDAVLKVDFPAGPCWRRYNHDGYGQRKDGEPFAVWGQGHPWPLLTGERGHRELAAGRDPAPYLRALENFATAAGLLPEQVWAGPELPERMMSLGKPTGAAMPLMWAHAEYIKLLRSAADGQVFDLIPEVAARYQKPHGHSPIEFWKFNRQVRTIDSGKTLRIQCPDSFILHWTANEWQEAGDAHSQAGAVGLHYVDLHTRTGQRAPLRFTFFWVGAQRWEGRDFAVALRTPD